MSVATILRANSKAYNKFSELCKEYIDFTNDSDYDAFIEILDTKERKYLTVESDLSVRLLCVIKIVLAKKIGGSSYKKELSPIAIHCIKFIDKNIDVIGIRHKECMENATIGAQNLSARARNILHMFTPVYLFFYIKSADDIKAVIQQSRNCGEKTSVELYDYALWVKSLYKDELGARQKPEDIFEGISPEKDAFISKMYEEMLGSLSVRSKNVVKSISDGYRRFCKLTLTEIDSARSCGRTSSKEIRSAQNKFQINARQILSASAEDFSACQIKYKYSFLSDNEVSFCGHYLENNGKLPMFFILERLLLSSKDRFSKFFILSNGLNCDALTLREIGGIEGISYERVRQICRKPPVVIVDLLNNVEWDKYPFGHCDYITETSVDFDKISQDENILYFTYDAFVDLLCNALDYTTIQVKGEVAAISKKLSESFDFHSSIEDLESTLKTKTYDNSIIPLETFVSPYIIEYTEVCNYVIDIYKDLLTQLEYEINSNDCIVINSNRVDIESILYAILKKEGSPLHIKEIFARFKQLHPEHKYKDANRIRPALLSSDRICSQGKSSTYALVEWNLYNGSRRDYANEILASSPVPLPRKDIINKVMLRFPESSEKSIASTISQSDQYELYVGDLLGLAGKKYPKDFILAEYGGTRKSFEERLNDLVEFFEKYHYSPQYSGSFEEQSLQRWVYNTRNGRTKITDEQRKQFDSVFEKYADYCLSGDEYTFSKRCEDYQAFVSEYFELPTRDSDLELTRWFENSLSQQFDDKRKEMFRKLISELSDYGFVF